MYFLFINQVKLFSDTHASPPPPPPPPLLLPRLLYLSRYSIPSITGSEGTTARWGNENPKSDIEWIMIRAAQVCHQCLFYCFTNLSFYHITILSIL